MKNWFSITQVTENIFALAEFNHWEKVVSYLAVDKTQAFLIDTGMGYASICSEVRKITTLPITVLLTHAHWDHIGSVSEFEKVYLFDDVFEQKSIQVGFNSNQIPELNNPEMFSNNFKPRKYGQEGINNFNVLNNNQILCSDTFDMKIIHTPGHTPGSVCFYIPQLNALFTGDTLYPGPLYAQLPESNISDFVSSIKKLSRFSSPELTIFPGHNANCCSSKLIAEANEVLKSAKNCVGKEKEVKGKRLSILLSA